MIAIIGILAAITIPIVGKVRKTAHRATCTSNLRQLHAAIMLHAADNKDCLIAADTGEQTDGSPSYVRWYQHIHDGVSNYESALTTYTGGGKGGHTLGKLAVCPENSAGFTTGSVDGVSLKSPYGWPYTVNYEVLLSSNQYGAKGQRRRLVQFVHPSQIPMMSDANSGPAWGATGWTGSYTPAPDQTRIGEPHAGKSNILWVDGHVSRKTRSELIAHIDAHPFKI